MNLRQTSAKLAFALACIILCGLGTLDEPLRVRFQLNDGVRIAGELTEWDADGFDGSFGRREWLELKTIDAWKLYRRLMDREDAQQWVDLGQIMLQMEFGEQRAERAFAYALKCDPDIQPAIDAARDEIAEAEAAEQQREAEAEKERLSTRNPEARDFGDQPWPELSEEERAAATEQMKDDAQKILQIAGATLEPVETEYFLFYSDMPRLETAKWARELDKMYARLAEIFKLKDGENIFWGKAVIFVFNSREAFELVEATAFDHRVPPTVMGLCHTIGPKVFVNFFRQPDDLDFAAVLVHETVHGFMHRYRSPKRLPTWANEGFAEYIAQILFDNSPVDENRRAQALQFVRNGGDVSGILSLEYTDGTWPGPNAVGYAVGYLMVGIMIQDQGSKFGDWVNAIKDGKPWQQALEEDFGTPRERLVEGFTRYYRVND